jgi:hypothetical protein
MKHYVILLISWVLLCSCPVEMDRTPPPSLPNYIVVAITAKNEMSVPVTIRMRHKYSWFIAPAKSSTVYSDWSVDCLAVGEEKLVGVEETIPLNWDSSSAINGFVLLDRNSATMLTSGRFSLSSFDLEIETSGGTISMTGYDTIDETSEETEMCALRIHNPYNNCSFFTYRQGITISTGFLLPINLVIKADGTYSFEHEPVKDSNGIHISWPIN